MLSDVTTAQHADFNALGNMLKGGANRNLRAHPLHPKNV